MNIVKLTEKKWNYKALAFILPVIGMMFVMLIGQYTPLGKHSMLYSDMYHQYYPFFVAYREALLSGESLLHSWSVGLGMDYLGLISYYLASPLNLLSILVPKGLLLQYFAMLMPIKLGLSGLFFYIFLTKTCNKEGFSTVLFSCFYALCAWALGFQWNVMWLDTFALLPLVVTGAIALLRDRKFVLYTITLFLSIAANYYIGFFTCIFIFLFFFCYEICRFKNIGRFFADLCIIAVFSILAIGMTAFLELPALAALQTTQSSVNQFPESFRLNIVSEHNWKGLLDAMRQVAGNMNGGLELNFKEGLPNLYCGVITNVLAFLYLTCRQIRWRDRICSVLLLLFFNVSFIIRQLDYIWHGFHFTNMIPYRFSFLYSFVMLYMAYRAWLLRKQFRLWQLIVALVFSIGLVLCNKDLSDAVLWAYNGAFLLLYFGLFFYHYITQQRKPSEKALENKQEFFQKRRKYRQICAYSLCIVMFLELCMNLVNFGVRFPGTTISNYPKGKSDAIAVIDHMEELEKDTLFYRAEATHTQTLNDGALNGYNGISTFTSSANVKVTEFMKALGYGAKNTYNRYCFEEGSPVSNLFLNLKYMLERDGRVVENAYFDSVFQQGNVTLLKNNAYLPLGFLANPQLLNVNFSDTGNRYVFQNELFSSATGIEESVWTIMPYQTMTIIGSDVTLKSQNRGGHCSYTTEGTSGGTITYTYEIDREGLFCVYLDLSKKNGFTVYKNEEKVYAETHSLPQLLSVSDVVPGDVIKFQFKCKTDEDGALTVNSAILDEAVFRRGYEILNESTLELTTFNNTLVSGTITCDRDGILYTSIPQNGNWSATVNGEPAQIALIGDAMVGLSLTKGTHTIVFTYNNPAFSLGWKISVTCLALFLGLYFLIYRPKRYRGKFEKQKTGR